MIAALFFGFQIADMHVYRIFGDTKKRGNFKDRIFDVKNTSVIKFQNDFFILILRRNRQIVHNGIFNFCQGCLDQFIRIFCKVFPNFRGNGLYRWRIEGKFFQNGRKGNVCIEINTQQSDDSFMLSKNWNGGRAKRYSGF